MPTQQDDNLKNSLIASTIMHVGGLLVLYFGLPVFASKEPLPIPWRPVPVDIVEIGAITNTRIQGDDAETAKTAPPTPPAPAPEQKPPEPPKPEVKPSAPEPKAAAAEPEPSPDDASLPTPKAKPKPPEPKKEAAAPAADPLASVLKNVAKMKPAAPKAEDARPGPKNDGTSKTGTAQGMGPALSDRLTISQEDSLRRQIGQCWNMPIGARNAEQLIVEVLIEMNPDRTVLSAKVVDQARYASDTHFRAAADAAMRALRHPKCTPLELPPDQYEQWKTIRFNFDPRDMI